MDLNDEGVRPQKAIVLVADAAVAQDTADLIAAMLSLNGYAHNGASVIDWPLRAVPESDDGHRWRDLLRQSLDGRLAPAQQERLRATLARVYPDEAAGGE